jgi:hypothetical protein
MLRATRLAPALAHASRAGKARAKSPKDKIRIKIVVHQQLESISVQLTQTSDRNLELRKNNNPALRDLHDWAKIGRNSVVGAR